MDSLTQIALGIATAELCASDKLNRRTFLYGAILGTIPDLDVIAGKFLSTVDGVAIHRGLSHSILFFILLSPVLGWIIWRIEKRRITYSHTVILAFFCLFTHVLLDLFTSWGVQVLWPLPHRLALKTIFVIDPLYTLPLIICLVIAWQKDNYKLRLKYIKTGIYISSIYLMITCCIKIYALQQFKNALERQQIRYEDLIVKPTAFNCILWNANVATKDTYLIGDYSIFDSKPITFTAYKKNKGLAQQLQGNPDFEDLKNISEGWYIVTKKNNLFYFNDLRFGLLNTKPNNPQFAFSYVFKEKNGKLSAYEVPKQKRDGKALVERILNRIKGN